ncbi:hypothetical protein BJX61DRAFT_137117 [Aspergillus egyptiacus]|nr:hypothetical protein BJX61DRAFT_137117 [Aspergillus egyptiacus]
MELARKVTQAEQDLAEEQKRSVKLQESLEEKSGDLRVRLEHIGTRLNEISQQQHIIAELWMHSIQHQNILEDNGRDARERLEHISTILDEITQQQKSIDKQNQDLKSNSEEEWGKLKQEHFDLLSQYGSHLSDLKENEQKCVERYRSIENHISLLQEEFRQSFTSTESTLLAKLEEMAPMTALHEHLEGLFNNAHEIVQSMLEQLQSETKRRSLRRSLLSTWKPSAKNINVKLSMLLNNGTLQPQLLLLPE